MPSMLIEALLLSADAAAVRVLQRVLEELGARIEQYSDPIEGLKRLWSWRFDTVIVDCDGPPAASELLREVREAAQNRSAVTVAVVARGAPPEPAFALGAQFVLEKPLTIERTWHHLHSAHGLMVGERRRYYRHPCAGPVVIVYGVNELPAKLVNLSRGGVAVEISTRMDFKQPVGLRFNLPDTNNTITPQAAVVWNSGGRLGIHFTAMTEVDEHRLETWLLERIPEEFSSFSSKHRAPRPKPVTAGVKQKAARGSK